MKTSTCWFGVGTVMLVLAQACANDEGTQESATSQTGGKAGTLSDERGGGTANAGSTGVGDVPSSAALGGAAGATATGTAGSAASVTHQYAGHAFSCEALAPGDPNGCALPVPGCLGYAGVEVDASTAALRFPRYCVVILGPVHQYYPNSPVTQYCYESEGTYSWVCPL